MEIVGAILSRPTAPFHESAVRDAISGLLAPCQRVQLREDAFGNLIAHYRGTGVIASATRYAFCAHMDHPGWVTPETTAGTPPDRVFLGGVPAHYLEGNRDRVREFGAFATWDLPDYELRDDRIYSRACDDLIGCAAIAATLETLNALDAPCEAYGLFTRGEEIGFSGAIHLARDGWLGAEGITVISLETSAERPPAKMGDGPIVRVGDKQSVFDAQVTAELLAVAAEAKITVQRCLMSGGTCEATAFRLYGVRCGALCVALGNYHNCGPGDRIEAEYVSLADVEGLTHLCTSLAQRTGLFESADEVLRARLEKNLEQYEPYYHRDRGHSLHE